MKALGRAQILTRPFAWFVMENFTPNDFLEVEDVAKLGPLMHRSVNLETWVLGFTKPG